MIVDFGFWIFEWERKKRRFVRSETSNRSSSIVNRTVHRIRSVWVVFRLSGRMGWCGSRVLEENAEFLKRWEAEMKITSARRALESIRRRSWTKVRMMEMFTSTARSDRSTLESMATPCSVKA